MKRIADYIFYDAWQQRELGIQPNTEYLVLTDLDDLKKGERVRFIGFDDVDNHYGIFVFTDANGNILEVNGDFSGSNSLLELKKALSTS